MSTRTLIYVIEQNAHFLQKLRQAVAPLDCRLEVSKEGKNVLEELLRLSPDLVVYGTSTGEPDPISFLQRVRAEGRLSHCAVLMLLEGGTGEVRWSANGPDDLLQRSASLLETTSRLQAGLRLAHLRKQGVAAKQELNSYKNQKEREGVYLNDATEYLVEIAAELQSEVCQSAQREEKSVRVAQEDTIAQAAATLRHEINNPLFAITASAEVALRHLHVLQTQYEQSAQDFEDLIQGIERIQRGSDRIQKVVQAISETLEATKKDYAAGITMLELSA